MENIRKHEDIRLVTNETRYKEPVRKPNFKNGKKLRGKYDGRGNGEE